MAAYLPVGWPTGVHPPGSQGFEETAVKWLLDVVPPDYRVHGVLVRHPVALATLARHHIDASVEGARKAYRSARAELGQDLPPSAVAAVLAVYQAEGTRLVATAKAVDLVCRALHGETFVPQLGAAPQDSGRAGAASSRPARRDMASGSTAPGRTAPGMAAPGRAV